ncbi:olfactory receptor 2D2-like [Zootoca vivipara]|uniref:olfactory receptor 2D2-like n=1 Tax=Zootoca vivipara TaxID=8524 RepID=UPI001591D016|nr:olfactory receptor 2D2-like [Zootoca vivipara]
MDEEPSFMEKDHDSLMQDRTVPGNYTMITQVYLVGLTSHRRTQIALFVIILIAYLISMASNLLIILLVQMDFRLHTPMYFFLSNLSLLEMCFTSTVVPQMLAHLLAGDGRLSFGRCAFQMYMACSLGCTEGLLLGAMAYDRYMAICCPLVYAVAMSPARCLTLAAISWVGAFLLSGLITAFIMQLPFCGPNEINHFNCEFVMVIRLGCTDTSFTEAIILGVGVFILIVPLATILISYGLIMATVMRMSSGESRSKAFSTCASHLMVVTMFYGCLIGLYMRPRSGTDPSHDKHVSIFYVVITPLLNPIIYTLRNKDVHAAVAKVFRIESINTRAEWS